MVKARRRPSILRYLLPPSTAAAAFLDRDFQDALNALQRRFQEERDAYAQIGDAPDIPHRENGFYKSWEEVSLLSIRFFFFLHPFLPFAYLIVVKVMNPFKFPDLGCLVQRSNARGDMSLECMEAIGSLSLARSLCVCGVWCVMCSVIPSLIICCSVLHHRSSAAVGTHSRTEGERCTARRERFQSRHGSPPCGAPRSL